MEDTCAGICVASSSGGVVGASRDGRTVLMDCHACIYSSFFFSFVIYYGTTRELSASTQHHTLQEEAPGQEHNHDACCVMAYLRVSLRFPGETSLEANHFFQANAYHPETLGFTNIAMAALDGIERIEE